MFTTRTPSPSNLLNQLECLHYTRPRPYKDNNDDDNENNDGSHEDDNDGNDDYDERIC